ncbi:MAG: IS200/IS605 family transposase [Thermodesulfobacteriota bacterium]
MSEYVHKRHNVSVLLYHLVCPAKYRRVVFTDEADLALRDICLEIAKRYKIVFVEIGVEKDYIHFLIQSVPGYSPAKIVRKIKSITAREIFVRVTMVKKQLWVGEFWTKGYFMSTVSRNGDENIITQYVRNQGRSDRDYKRLHSQGLQMELF